MIRDSCPVCRSMNSCLRLDDEDRALDSSIFGSGRTKITHGRILRCIDCGFGFRQLRSNSDEMADLYRKMDVGVYEIGNGWPQGDRRTAFRHSETLHGCGARVECWT